MPTAEFRSIPRFLSHVIQVPIDIMLDPALERELVAADCPIHLRFLAGVEAVDVYECGGGGGEALREDGFVGECAGGEGDVAEC